VATARRHAGISSMFDGSIERDRFRASIGTPYRTSIARPSAGSARSRSIAARDERRAEEGRLE
jgi:hypothetical protein